jgi:UDP-N-acetylglucosamine transferase subunit ALG13
LIFLTVGTQLPFDRLVEAVDAWAAGNPGHAIFGQIAEPGPSGYRPRNFDWAADLEPVDFEARFRAASHIVAHAGMGTIIGALGQSKPLLVMPRRAHLGEQRNDHQFATVRRLCARPGIARAGILAAFEAEEVAARMDALLAAGAPGKGAAGDGAAGDAAGETAGRAGDGRGGGGGPAPIPRFAEKRLTDAIRAAILG